jgi:hypothetical protein
MSKKKLGLLEMIEGVGEDKIGVQNLLESMKGVTLRKSGETEVTFFTQEINPTEIMRGNPQKTGLVIWFPTEELLAFVAARKVQIGAELESTDLRTKV